MTPKWLATLLTHVGKYPCGVIRLSGSQWGRLAESRKGPTEFTIARAHALVEKIRIGTLVFVFGTEGEGEDGDVPDAAWLGIVNYRAAVTTLESSIRVANGFELKPNTEDKIASLIKNTPSASTLLRQLESDSDVILLSPKVSVELITALKDKNSPGLSRLAAYLDRPATFRGNVEMQADAVRVAMKLFELAPSNRPDEVYVSPDQPTAIEQISLLEDTVIQHDTHAFPGLEFVEADLTGRVLFRKADEEIEIFTANKLPLETAMGVDLVYLNLVKSNVALVQYKMLAPVTRDKEKDWIYRPDGQLEAELKRMDAYAQQLAPDESEYRLSAGAFFLKFVQRDGQLGKGILLPVDYFRRIQKDPNSRARGETWSSATTALGAVTSVKTHS